MWALRGVEGRKGMTRPARCAFFHPRDLISQALALGQYLGQPPVLTIPLLDAAVATYFVEEDAEDTEGQ